MYTKEDGWCSTARGCRKLKAAAARRRVDAHLVGDIRVRVEVECGGRDAADDAGDARAVVRGGPRVVVQCSLVGAAARIFETIGNK